MNSASYWCIDGQCICGRLICVVYESVEWDEDEDEEEEPPPDRRLHQPKKAHNTTIAITAPINPAMTSPASALAVVNKHNAQRTEKRRVIDSTTRPTPRVETEELDMI